jgi:hypothetical protein
LRGDLNEREGTLKDLRARLELTREDLAQHELALREQLTLPPFRALAELSGPGSAELFEALGLEGAAIGDDRWLVRASDHQTLCDRLARTQRPRQRVKVIVDPTGV